MKRARMAAWVATSLVLVTLTGCARTTSGAEEVARQFVHAILDRDGAAACRLLTPKAAESAGGTAKMPCTRAVLHLSEDGADATSAQVWGDAAIVHIGSDTLFLRRLAEGWHVSAAGCTKEPAAPYDCDLEA